MKRKSIPAYDLIKVYVTNKPVEARPVQWDGKDFTGQGVDKDGNDINAIAYITTCPNCGDLIQFMVNSVVKDGDHDTIVCNTCATKKKKVGILHKQVKPENKPEYLDREEKRPGLFSPESDLKPAEFNEVKESTIVDSPTPAIEETPASVEIPPAEIPSELVAQNPDAEAPILAEAPITPPAPVDESRFKDPIKSGLMKVE